MTLDQLYEFASSRGIEIDDVPMRKLRALSLPDGCIAMDRRKFESETEYKCELAHEIGHCMTNSFYNIHTQVSVRELNEYRANRFAAELLVPLTELRKIMNRGGLLLNRILARIFNVTLEFIDMVLEVFEQEIISAAHTLRTERDISMAISRGIQSFIHAKATIQSG